MIVIFIIVLSILLLIFLIKNNTKKERIKQYDDSFKFYYLLTKRTKLHIDATERQTEEFIQYVVDNAIRTPHTHFEGRILCNMFSDCQLCEMDNDMDCTFQSKKHGIVYCDYANRITQND